MESKSYHSFRRLIETLSATPMDLEGDITQATYMLFDCHLTGRALSELCDPYVNWVTITSLRKQDRDAWYQRCQSSTVTGLAHSYQEYRQLLIDLGHSVLGESDKL